MSSLLHCYMSHIFRDLCYSKGCLLIVMLTADLVFCLWLKVMDRYFIAESTVPGLLTHQSVKKVHNEEADELESSQWAPDATLGSPVAATGSQKQAKKVESQSNSSKSESMQNSPKSCPTPEVSMEVPSVACAF